MLKMNAHLWFQVFDNDPQRILNAVMILEERQPDIIDINMGCSAKNVFRTRRRSGIDA